MDQERFDMIARALGASGSRRAGLRAALAGLLGAGGIAALDAEADARRKDRGRTDGPAADRKRKHECGPDKPCLAGFDCVKKGKKRRCVCASGVTCGTACCAAGQACVDGACADPGCDPPCANGYVCEGTTCACPSGVECGDACCAAGQTCQDGACVTPEPGSCIVQGEPCKAVGRPCCAGLACASGQGGETDVACYVPKTGPCATTADCVYGTVCTGGRCTPPPPPPLNPVAGLGTPCNPSADRCTAEGASCTAYASGEGPAGTYCLLPLGVTCTGDPDCTCYKCFYPNGSVAATTRAGRRGARSETPRLACCGPEGYTCQSDRNCCLGTSCIAGTCQREACDVCASGCPYTTIKAAYDAKPAGGTITIAPGEYRGSANAVVATKSMTFRRCGATGSVVWRAPSNDQALETSQDNSQAGIDLAVIGIDFRWGGSSDAFVKIYRPRVDGDRHDFTMLDCTLVGNAEKEAMAIEANVTATIADSEFRGNTSSSGGTGTILQGENIDATIARCRFLDNTQTGSNGGAGLYLDSTNGQARVEDSEFRGNVTTGGYGGGAAVNSGTLALHNVTVDGNLATNNSGGGGVAVTSGNGRLILSGSTAVTGNAMDSWGNGGSGAYCGNNDSATCRQMMASGVSYATVYGNTPAFTECAKFRADIRQPVDCVTWEPNCLVQGETCPGANACCQGTSCGPAGDGTATTCCVGLGARCTSASDCCKTGSSNMICAYTNGANRCQNCLATGESCFSNDSCCSGTCNNFTSCA